MELNRRQRVQAEVFVNRSGSDVLTLIDFNIIVPTVEEGRSFLLHCRNYHIVVDRNQKFQLQRKNAIGDNKMNLNVFVSIVLFVSHLVPYGGA